MRDFRRNQLTQNQLTTTDIHGSDPLASLLFKRLQLRPYAPAVFFILAGLFYGFALPKFWGVAPISDLISIINIVLVFPTAGYFYAYQPNSVLRVYNSVNRFLREEEHQEIPYEELRIWHARRVWWLTGIALGGVSAAFGVIEALTQVGVDWHNANWMQIFIAQFIRFLAVAMLGTLTARHIATAMKLNKLFEHAQFPLTLDADRIEVFNAIKKFSYEIVGVIAVVGLELGLQPLIFVPPMPEYAFYVVMYFIVSPVAFFFPLLEAHRRMVYIKEQMLEKLYDDFQEESYKLYANVNKDKRGDSANSYLKDSEALTSIKQTIELIKQSPEWPFEGTFLYRLVVTVISPFILAVWDIAINVVHNLFLR